MSKRELAAALREGHPIDPRALDDTQYRGVSLGLPPFMIRLTWLKFRKTFHRDPSTGALRGWNVRLQQNGLDAPNVARIGPDGRAMTFGHYEVVPSDSYRPPNGAQGLVIDYGRGRNGMLDPLNRVRDPLVALEAHGAQALLGWSYADLGVRFGTGSYFLLELEGPLEEVVPAVELGTG